MWHASIRLPRLFHSAALLFAKIIAWLGAASCTLRQRKYHRRRISSPPCLPPRRRKKPDWVRREIVRLKAHLPEHGCRKIVDAFNRVYAASGMTVGRTWVAEVIRAHRYEISCLRQLWKHCVPPPSPANHTWGIDATGKTDVLGKTHTIFGIIDHGSRCALTLQPIPNLTTIAILRLLLDAIERLGMPKFLRTDNAAQFRSRLFRFSMACLGIRLRFNKPGMPWMNGRVERFFGTLKERLNLLSVVDFAGLATALDEFAVWYNEIRPHQHLGGRTPAEAWNGIEPFRRVPKDIRYVVGWDGLLTGFRLRY